MQPRSFPPPGFLQNVLCRDECLFCQVRPRKPEAQGRNGTVPPPTPQWPAEVRTDEAGQGLRPGPGLSQGRSGQGRSVAAAGRPRDEAAPGLGKGGRRAGPGAAAPPRNGLRAAACAAWGSAPAPLGPVTGSPPPPPHRRRGRYLPALRGPRVAVERR